MRDQCVNFWRYTLLAFLCISIVAAFFVLGVDLDWLLNGPEFVAKVWSRIKERWAIISLSSVAKRFTFLSSLYGQLQNRHSHTKKIGSQNALNHLNIHLGGGIPYFFL